MTNSDYAALLREAALYYEMFDVPFRPQAYERAAEAVEGNTEDVDAALARGGRKALDEIPGVGPAIAEHLEEAARRGSFKELDQFRRRVPVDLPALTAVEGVGPKTALALWRGLKVTGLDGLERAARTGKIARLPHFGEKTQAAILKAVERRRHAGSRKILGYVLPVAERLSQLLAAAPGVKRAAVAGSVRRRQETVGDFDFIVTTARPEAAIDAVAAFPEVAEVMERGKTKLAVRLKSGMSVDVRVVPDAVFGAALQHFTGSKEHNVALRRLALERGLKLNEYGLWRGRRRLACRTEEEVYRALGLDYIEPELRTATGEIEAAAAGRLPRLIPYGAVRGDLQVQTDWSDGVASVEAMAEAARALGREYVAVTDHTKALGMAHGLDERRLARQGALIDKLNAEYAAARKNFRVLKGAEVNILKDGRLDITDTALAKLDFVGVAVHGAFSLPRAEQTERIIRALKNPHVDCLFHPTGRLLGAREPYDLDMAAVLKAAKATGTAVEIDAFPDRSDLRDAHVRAAVKLGVKLLVDTDAHAPEHLAYLRLGEAIARRGWARTSDVLNTRPLAALKKWLAAPKAKRR